MSEQQCEALHECCSCSRWSVSGLIPTSTSELNRKFWKFDVLISAKWHLITIDFPAHLTTSEAILLEKCWNAITLNFFKAMPGWDWIGLMELAARFHPLLTPWRRAVKGLHPEQATTRWCSWRKAWQTFNKGKWAVDKLRKAAERMHGGRWKALALNCVFWKSLLFAEAASTAHILLIHPFSFTSYTNPRASSQSYQLEPLGDFPANPRSCLSTSCVWGLKVI